MAFRYYYADKIREQFSGFKGTDEELQEAIDDISLLYNSAIKVLETRLKILSDDFEKKHSYMPIHHVQSRLKTFESIMEKQMSDRYKINRADYVIYNNGTLDELHSATKKALKTFLK